MDHRFFNLPQNPKRSKHIVVAIKTNMDQILADLHKKEIGSPEKPLIVNSGEEDEDDDEDDEDDEDDSEEEEELENGDLPDLNDKEDEKDGGMPDVNGEGKKTPGVEGDGKDENEGSGGGAPSVRSRKPSRKIAEELAMKAAV